MDNLFQKGNQRLAKGRSFNLPEQNLSLRTGIYKNLLELAINNVGYLFTTRCRLFILVKKKRIRGDPVCDTGEEG